MGLARPPLSLILLSSLDASAPLRTEEFSHLFDSLGCWEMIGAFFNALTTPIARFQCRQHTLGHLEGVGDVVVHLFSPALHVNHVHERDHDTVLAWHAI